MNSRLLFLRRFTAGRPRPGPHMTSGSRITTLLRGVGFTASLTTAYTVGSLYPPDLATFISPRVAPPAPSLGTPEAKAHTDALEERLQNLPLLKSLRSREDKQEWYESRPYTGLPDEVRVNNLTAGALSGPGKLAVRPLIRVKNDESEAWGFVHLGRGLCGHDGIVHGGLMATLLDESMGRVVSTNDVSAAFTHRHLRQAFFNLPNRIALTAKLTLNYRAPTKADQVRQSALRRGLFIYFLPQNTDSTCPVQFVVIKCKLESQEGRKAVISSRVEDMQGNLLIEASYAMPLSPPFLHGLIVFWKIHIH